MELASQFCMQGAPDSATELTKRIQQSNHLIKIIGGIANASRTAAQHPKFAAQILSSTEGFAARLTPDRCTGQASDQLAQQIAEICATAG